METQIVLVRHGETAWSAAGRHTGRSDVALTERGRAQARLVGATLGGWAFARAFSSPLARARETAELARVRARAEPLPAAVEWDYGDLEGRTNDDITRERPGFDKWAAHSLPGGESVRDVGRRAEDVIAVLDAAAASGPVVLFAHGHFLAVVVAVWLGLPPCEGRRFVLETATATVLGVKRKDRVLRLLNHRCTAANPIPETDDRLEAHGNRH